VRSSGQRSLFDASNESSVVYGISARGLWHHTRVHLQRSQRETVLGKQEGERLTEGVPKKPTYCEGLQNRLSFLPPVVTQKVTRTVRGRNVASRGRRQAA